MVGSWSYEEKGACNWAGGYYGQQNIHIPHSMIEFIHRSCTLNRTSVQKYPRLTHKPACFMNPDVQSSYKKHKMLSVQMKKAYEHGNVSTSGYVALVLEVRPRPRG